MDTAGVDVAGVSVESRTVDNPPGVTRDYIQPQVTAQLLSENQQAIENVHSLLAADNQVFDANNIAPFQNNNQVQLKVAEYDQKLDISAKGASKDIITLKRDFFKSINSETIENNTRNTDNCAHVKYIFKCESNGEQQTPVVKCTDKQSVLHSRDNSTSEVFTFPDTVPDKQINTNINKVSRCVTFSDSSDCSAPDIFNDNIDNKAYIYKSLTDNTNDANENDSQLDDLKRDENATTVKKPLKGILKKTSISSDSSSIGDSPVRKKFIVERSEIKIETTKVNSIVSKLNSQAENSTVKDNLAKANNSEDIVQPDENEIKVIVRSTSEIEPLDILPSTENSKKDTTDVEPDTVDFVESKISLIGNIVKNPSAKPKPTVPHRNDSLNSSVGKTEQHIASTIPKDNAHNRLTESQSKIAKLQQSLPTKLNSATVESLKVKYSPTNFGYPKTFVKSPISSLKLSPSKIPVQFSVLDKKVNVEPADEESKIIPETTETKEENSAEKLNVVNPVEEEHENKSDETDANIQFEILICHVPKCQSEDSPVEVIDLNRNKVEQELDNFPDKDLTKNDTVINSQSIAEDAKLTDEILVSETSTETNGVEINEDDEDDPFDALKPPDAYADFIKEYTMSDDKKPTKKRSNSFRRIFPSGLFGSQKDKNKSDTKNGKSDKNKKELPEASRDENAYFNRNNSERHTFNCHYANKSYDCSAARSDFIRTQGASCDKNYRFNSSSGATSFTPSYSMHKPAYSQMSNDDYSLPIDARMNQLKQTLEESHRINEMVSSTPSNKPYPGEDYVCMDNVGSNRAKIEPKCNEYINIQNVSKFIDTSTSSSSTTIQSDNTSYNDRSTESPEISKRTQQVREFNNRYSDSSSPHSRYRSNSDIERNARLGFKYQDHKPHDRLDTPESFSSIKNFDYNQEQELIKPKAIIPINTERPLPNPFHNQIQLTPSDTTIFDPMYGNVRRESLEPPKTPINTEPFFSRNNSQLKPPNKPIEVSTISNVNATLDGNTAKDKSENVVTVRKPDDYLIKEEILKNNIISNQQKLNQESYETNRIYGNIQPKDINTTSEKLDNPYGTVYGDLVPVSAHVKITKAPIISPSKKVTPTEKLRARSLSPEQRYKLDMKSRPTAVINLKNVPEVPDSIPNTITEENKQKKITTLEPLSPKLSNLPKLDPKSPKVYKKTPKKETPELRKKLKDKNNEPTHQNLEIELDYPDNNFNEIQAIKISPQKNMYINSSVSAKSTYTTFFPNSKKDSKSPESIKSITPIKGASTSTQSTQISKSELEKETSRQTSDKNLKVRVPTSPPVNSLRSSTGTVSRAGETNVMDRTEESNTKMRSPVISQVSLSNSEVSRNDDLDVEQRRFGGQLNQPEENQQLLRRNTTGPRTALLPIVKGGIRSQNVGNTEVSPTKVPVKETPKNSRNSNISPKPDVSPQKLQNMINLESFYWAQKEKELAQKQAPLQQLRMSSPSPSQIPIQRTSSQRRSQSRPPERNITSTPTGRYASNIPPRTEPVSPNSKVQLSPQKQQNLQNVEAFYWQKIREMKEEEMIKQHQMLLQSQLGHSVVLRTQDDVEAAQRMRSRSVSPHAFVRNGRRSLSLPRGVNYTPPNQRLIIDPRQVRNYSPEIAYKLVQNQNAPPNRVPADYGYIRQYQQGPPQRQPVTSGEQHFVRGTPQRNTISGPVSQHRNTPPNRIVNDVIYENYVPGVEYRHQAQAVMKVDAGASYAPIFKRGSLMSNQPSVSPQDPNMQLAKKVSFSGAQRPQSNSPVRGVWPTKNGYVQSPPTRRNRSDSMGSDNVFTPKTPNTPGQYFFDYQQEVVDPVYGKTTQKQTTVTNKVCDIYGRIHDSTDGRKVPAPNQLYGQIQKTGVIYGELKRYPVGGSPVVLRNSKVTNESGTTSLPAEQLSPKNGNRRNGQFFHEDPNIGNKVTVNSGVRSATQIECGRACEAPNRPLPPLPRDSGMGQIPRSSAYRYTANKPLLPNPIPIVSESESGSEAGEVQRILQNSHDPSVEVTNSPYSRNEEEWNADGKSGRGPPGSDSGGVGGGNADGEVRGSRGGRSTRRDDPRRHTLSGDQHLYQPGGGQGGILARTMDLEGSLPRGYPPPSSAMLFDDDPGIMSEVETSSTGFRRGGKQRSSLPVVRTPSKTLERPLGLVFLQYRNETKRALLPNEITSIDTVKALFVRSFPKQLTMEYLDSPLVKIYIHDSSKDMFYELEDLRSHLRDIRDRSVLRLFESADVSGGLPGAGQGIAGGVGHFEDQSYFSEPEFDSEYQHQHIHKSKSSAKAAPPYYMGSSSTLPRGGPLLRTYSPAVGAPVPADRIKSLPGQTGGSGAPPKPVRTYSSSGAPPPRAPDRYAPFLSPAELRHRSDNPLYCMPDRMHTDGYMSSPERGSRGQYEDPYYSQFAPRSGSITPVIDEEASDTELLDDSYSLYGAKLPPGGARAVPAPRSQFPAPAAVPYDATRIRVEHMERQLANLTGLVQKALTQAPPTPRDFLQVPPGRENFRAGDEFDKNSSSSSTSLPDESYLRSDTKAPKLGKSSCHKSVSFEKSVSFSDEPPDMNSPKQHSPQHAADTKPPKPAIKSSTLPRTSSQERDRLKPAPPPKPAALAAVQYDSSRHLYRDLQLTPEMYNQLRGLQKKAKDLRAEVRNLRRMSQAQAHSVRETIRDTFIKIRTMLIVGGDQAWQADMDQEKIRLSREEDLYKQEMLRLEKDLSDLESTVEELRGNVINRKTRVNMSDVENMALILSKSSKTVADLKVRFPSLQEGMKGLLTSEMEKVVREEKFLKEEPERLESALRRCKKLTGTLVTLKRLASVQEQRLPCASNANPDDRLSPSADETPPVTPTSAQHGKPPTIPTTRPVVGPGGIGGDSLDSESGQRPENALDALLDELQTFSRPHAPISTPQPQGLPPAHAPTMAEIGRKGSMDSHALTVSTGTGSLRRLHSYPSGSDTDNSPPIQPAPRAALGVKPPLPERNTELLQALAGRRVPPPPPPRTSSRSPLASPTSPGVPPRAPSTLQHIQNVQNMVQPQQSPPQIQSQFEAARENLGLGTLRRNVPGRSSLKERSQTLPRNIGSNLQVHTHNLTDSELQSMMLSASNSSSCESVNSQEGAKKGNRQEQLEMRHQELLKKQKALQEQYARLQQLQRGNNALTVVPPTPDLLLKKTGSESNILQKMGMNMSTPQFTGSLTHLANPANGSAIPISKGDLNTPATTNASTTSKVYETDIL